MTGAKVGYRIDRHFNTIQIVKVWDKVNFARIIDTFEGVKADSIEATWEKMDHKDRQRYLAALVWDKENSSNYEVTDTHGHDYTIVIHEGITKVYEEEGGEVFKLETEDLWVVFQTINIAYSFYKRGVDMGKAIKQEELKRCLGL